MATVEELRERIDDLEIDRDLAQAEIDGAQAKIEKAEARKDKVKPEIYEKVVGEYVAARDAAQAKFDGIQSAIDDTGAEIERIEREAEEEARRQEEEARRQEEEARQREEAERRQREEEEARAREEETRRLQEEAERVRQAEEQRLREEEEQRARAEAERLEAEERERQSEANAAQREEERREASTRVETLMAELDESARAAQELTSELEEIDFRKEMEEFDSEEAYHEAAEPLRARIEELKTRDSAGRQEVARLCARFELPLPDGIEPVAVTEAAVETLLEEAAVVASVIEETLAESPTIPAGEESTAPVPIETEIMEDEAGDDYGEGAVDEETLDAGDGDWNELEKRFFASSSGHRFFVNPCLILQEPSGSERVFELIHESILVGSAGLGDVDIFINHESVDKKHARIKLEHGRYVIKDLASRKGVFLNGKKIRKERLNHLDKLKIGDVLLQVRLM